MRELIQRNARDGADVIKAMVASGQMPSGDASIFSLFEELTAP
ncbi:hypothetical protein [Streptosporangium sp. NPDC000396]